MYDIRLPEDFSPEQRGQEASRLFLEGYNCCQAVLLAFRDILEPVATAELLAVLSSGFGGGMARMREVCGSFTGMTMIAGVISPAGDPSVKDARKNNYALVQDFASRFKEVNGGSIVCGELLGLFPRRAGLAPATGKSCEQHLTTACGDVIAPEGPEPTARTPEFYKKRPCPQIIANAARIVAEELQKHSTTP